MAEWNRHYNSYAGADIKAMFEKAKTLGKMNFKPQLHEIPGVREVYDAYYEQRVIVGMGLTAEDIVTVDPMTHLRKNSIIFGVFDRDGMMNEMRRRMNDICVPGNRIRIR